MFDRLREDISTFKRRDPAARSALEILFLYPGLKAIRMHRRANWCYRRRMFFLARWISQRAARKTGIEIHPAATIGRRFFIDHGTGIVVGETTIIGDHVKLYQGVTLGALSPRGGRAHSSGKRHPTVGDGATIYSGASIFGGETVIGENAVVGGNAFLTESVADNARVVIRPPETFIHNL